MNCLYKEVCDLECSDSCIRYIEMRARQNIITLVPDDCDYSVFCTLADIKSDIKAFVEGGDNLYLVSKNTGNGKTTWAIKLMLKYFDEVWAGNGLRCRGLFIHVPTFLLKCKDFDNKDPEFNDMKSNLLLVDLVVWDDIGSTGMSNYDLSQLLMYIDQRILAGKSNIFTGNLMYSDLEKSLGSRLASRIWNTSSIAELKGKDKR